jgi:hypothetical protein
MALFKSKTITTDGRKWYYSICYKTINGERKRKKSKLYATKLEAQEAERQFLIANSINSKININFEEMYYQYLNYNKESVKGSTTYTKDSRIKNHILPYFRSKGLELYIFKENTLSYGETM